MEATRWLHCLAEVARLSVGLVAAGLLLAPGSASGQVCSLPEPLDSLLPDTVPLPGPYATIREQGVPFEDLQLGIGHLRPTESTREWEWLSKIALPISETPGATPWQWIAKGWLIDVGEGRMAPFGVSGLLETGYEDATFIVLEATADGWLKIRFAPPSADPDSGTGWVPDCALRGKSVDLGLEPWGERFLSDQISPLFFRSDVAHVLRRAPRVDGARLGTIAGDYHLEPLEIDGDWMRVIVKQPSDYCAWDLESVTQTGWIRWRSADRGPWVWYYTRGC